MAGQRQTPLGRDASAARLEEALVARLAAVAVAVGVSPREHEVLHLLVLGRSAPEIGTALHIAARTVRFHMGNLLAKIGAESRLDIVRALVAGERAAPAPAEVV